MPSIRIKTELNDQLYFLTFTIKNWYYILDRHNRFTILLDSLKFCQKNKGLQIYAWVYSSAFTKPLLKLATDY